MKKMYIIVREKGKRKRKENNDVINFTLILFIFSTS